MDRADPPENALPGVLALPDAARGRAIVVGLSGGLDSSVLLHALRHADIDASGLRAVHVHHGLQRGADAWADHCREVCAGLGVPLRVIAVAVDRDGGLGPEGAARAARRRAFAAAMDADDVLALAHHRDDQAETFLLRALRASGPDGLASMWPWRRFEPGWCWRPLLAVPRAALAAYAAWHGLRWIEDPSNAVADADRNFLRARVLPLLRERWPHADAAFARSAALAGDAAALLGGDDAVALAMARTLDPQVLSLPRLRACAPARRARVLRHWVASLGLPPLPAQGVRHCEDALLDAAGDRVPAFAWHGAVLRAWRDLLHAGRQRPALPPEWRVAWDGRAPLALPDGGTLRVEGDAAFDMSVVARARHGGERIALPGRAHTHALKHVLQSLGIPPWQRERLPLLCDADDGILAAGDLAYSAAFDAWLRARAARLVWDPA